MARTPNSARHAGVESSQVFRQFAWNLAGTLAKNRPGKANGIKPARPAKAPSSVGKR